MKIPLDIPAGLVSDDTTFAAAGRWADGSNVRFWEGRPQTIGGWEALSSDLLTGVCRNAFPWADNAAALNVAFGTHSTLQVWTGGGLYDVTPMLARPAVTLSSPFTVADGSATVTVRHVAHGLSSGDAVAISGAVAVGRIMIGGAKTVTVVDADSYTFVNGAAADTVKTLGANPLAVVSGSPVVTVSETGHAIADGAVVTIAGATAVGGVTPNGAFAVTVIDANSYKFTFSANATSTVSGGGSAVVATVPATGGGPAVVIAPQNAFAAGTVDGTGGAGYGTGAYSTGAYSSPSTADYFPRTWSLAAWGENLIASPRAGTVFAWANDAGVRAAPLVNAPRKITHMLVSPTDQVMALGCNEEVSGIFNPLCIRHSSVRNNTQWNTAADTTAREYVLPGGGRIVAGRVIGASILVWTSHALFLGTFLGSLSQPWRFDRVGEKCGLIGPSAAVVVGQSAYWLGPDLQFYQYDLGGAPRPLICPIRDDMADNFAQSQGDKAVASSVSAFGEVRFDYPDARDGLENSRYLTYSLVESAWSRGRMARSAFVDAGPSPSPVGVRPDGAVYWHERGASADGAPIAWFIETADQYLSEDQTVLVRGVWPDFAHQVGPATLAVTARLKPQDSETSSCVVALSPGDDRADLRATGRLFRVRFSGASSPTRWRLGRAVFDVAAAGGR